MATLSEKELKDLQTAAAIEFTHRNPAYLPCPKNREALYDYMRRNNLDLRFPGSFQIAWDSLTQRRLGGELDLITLPEDETPPVVETKEVEIEPLPPAFEQFGTRKAFHRKEELAALREMPLKDLKRQAQAETAGARHNSARRDITPRI